MIQKILMNIQLGITCAKFCKQVDLLRLVTYMYTVYTVAKINAINSILAFLWDKTRCTGYVSEMIIRFQK